MFLVEFSIDRKKLKVIKINIGHMNDESNLSKDSNQMQWIVVPYC